MTPGGYVLRIDPIESRDIIIVVVKKRGFFSLGGSYTPLTLLIGFYNPAVGFSLFFRDVLTGMDSGSSRIQDLAFVFPAVREQPSAALQRISEEQLQDHHVMVSASNQS